MEIDPGTVDLVVREGVGRIIFAHPKANSLPLAVLDDLAKTVAACDGNPDVKAVLISSRGEKTFCAGASFDEFQAITTEAEGEAFFLGFAKLILAMKQCHKLIVVRVQGKTVGGGVGIAAAADYAIAHSSASIRLSEFELGIGPFTIGPAVERRIGVSHFAALSIDSAWRDAFWCLERGLYAAVCDEQQELDEAVEELARKLAGASIDATASLKQMLWHGTDHWATLLPERAKISGRLLVAHRRSTNPSA